MHQSFSHGAGGGDPEGDVAREIARALAAVAGEREGVFLFPVSVDEENSGAFERNFGEVKPVVAEFHADVAAVGPEADARAGIVVLQMVAVRHETAELHDMIPACALDKGFREDAGIVQARVVRSNFKRGKRERREQQEQENVFHFF